MDIDDLASLTSLIGLSLTLLCSLPAAKNLLVLVRSSRQAQVSKLYQDEDGEATEESQAAFSDKWPKAAITVLSLLGFVDSMTLAVVGTVSQQPSSIEYWLLAAAWALILIQTTSIVPAQPPTKSFELALLTFYSCAFIFLSSALKDIIVLQKDVKQSTSTSALHICQIILAFLDAIACLSIPRRPDVFHNGKIVDRSRTTSALERYSFGWSTYMLKCINYKESLGLDDFPRMDLYTRCETLSSAWRDANQYRPLWKDLVLAHKWAFVTQWFLTLVTAVGDLTPQFALLHILRILETPHNGRTASEAWLWVAGLGLATALTSWVDSWNYWLSWAHLAIPVRAQLSALIFEKSMRRKDVKATSAMKMSKAGAEDTDADGSSADSNEDDDLAQKSRQSIVNLIGVDGQRVSIFCIFNRSFPSSFFKLVISLAFLLKLIGWKSLLAGFATMSITLPLNIYTSKIYSRSQGGLMKLRDAKMGVVSEALQGIRQIKFSALEDQWQARIGQVRDQELKELWTVFVADTLLWFCWVASPIFLTASSLAVYAIVHKELSPSVAFTSIGVFRQLEATLAVMPELITHLIDCKVSLSRIQDHLRSSEIVKSNLHADTISFKSACIAWPSDQEKENTAIVLRDVNLSFPEKELSIVSGQTGSGKSLLLASILGEAEVVSGNVSVPLPVKERHDDMATANNWIIPSAIAFVSQIPWIENASIKGNIIFGLPFDNDRYHKVVECCALRKDFEVLPDGELTELGANGINISGGQKWRITFARALYSRAGILILDDIFSAVDAHVGRQLLKALTGELSTGRTRILATHHVALCKSAAKYIVELGTGVVQHAGLVSELEEVVLEDIIEQERRFSGSQQDLGDSVTRMGVSSPSDGDAGEVKVAVKKFIEEESREHGAVQKKIFVEYLSSAGTIHYWGFALMLFALGQAVTLGCLWWLRLWINSYQDESIDVSFASQTPPPIPDFVRPLAAKNGLTYYLTIYVLLSLLSAIVTVCPYLYIYTGSIRASRRLFENLSFTILRTPLRWVDTVPIGRVLNRFTGDFSVVDSQLGSNIAWGLNAVFGLLGIVVAGLFVSPYILLFSIVLFTICIHTARQYLATAREVKRIESIARSPIFEQFASALTGLATIRAFDKTQTYIQKMYQKIDDYTVALWHLWLLNQWLGLRMGILGALFATGVAIVVLSVENIDAALAGFALAFSLQYSTAMISAIRHYANFVLNFTSAERVIEYANIPTETSDGADPPASWPSTGGIEVNSLVVGYADDLPPVLKDIGFSIKGSERVGVVGRTGAGKSSLTLALFRFLEARSGSIHIDKLDISKIKLQALRSRMSIIPQDPVLFSGTVRSNLDPFDDYTDSDLKDALQRVHLIPGDQSSNGTSTSSRATKDAVFDSLSSPVSEGGLNLSQGQRQLLCLARAIVSRPKIMVLDEATSAVDMETDQLIQRSIREEFTNSTLIVIAHRLSTVADFDKVLVIDEGSVKEFGKPIELMQIENGSFRSMVQQSGERERILSLITGIEHIAKK